jgi:hypothetical protein
MAAAGGHAAGPSSDGVDCSALPLTTVMDDIISTFEDGTGNVNQAAGRGGGFYMYNDGTGMQTPPTGMLPPAASVSRCGSTYALCMSGKNFMTWGAGMGTDFAPLGPKGADGMGTKMTYDASKYKGVAFWAKSNSAMTVPVRVSFKDKDTAPEGGLCDKSMSSGAEACNDDFGKALMFSSTWQPFNVTFAELRQGAWGKAFPSFMAQNVYSIQFQVSQGLDFDVCVDDLVFTH